MANPLLSKNRVQGQRGSANSGNDIASFLQQFNSFRQQFNGNPNQILQNALSSGKVTQSQVDDAYNKARQLMSFWGSN